ncbi:MAG: glycosyltransferase [Puniceicoccaceae bacterium]
MSTLFFDTTKSRKQGHFSGLKRVSARLWDAFSDYEFLDLKAVHWSSLRRSYVDSLSGKAIGTGETSDLFLTPEVFALRERPFSRSWLARFRGRSASLFYDAIPFFHPEITWPHSVRRFPRWFMDLEHYDQVFFISRHAMEEAGKVHQLTGLPRLEGTVLPIGCDYMEQPPVNNPDPVPVLLNVGILEPRKGQDCLLSACDRLWMEGFEFKLVFLGRVNPHYGRPLQERINLLRESGRDIEHVEQADDACLAEWHQRASLTVQPSRAEGFGLPVLESLWAGCPVLASDQPGLDSVPGLKGVEVLDEVSEGAIEAALKRFLESPEELTALRGSISSKELPTWTDSALFVLQQLGLSINS